MTGFGQARGLLAEAGLRLSVDIRSVNARFREVKVRQPFSAAVEAAVRSAVEAVCGRGRVDVRVELAPGEDDGPVSAAALERAISASSSVMAAAASKGLAVVAPSAAELLKIAQGLSGPPRDESRVREVVVGTVNEALTELSQMRRREGEALTAALDELVSDLTGVMDRLPPILAAEGERIRTDVANRLKAAAEASQAQGPALDRVASEVALVLSRGDLTEERVRVLSHLDAVRAVLRAPAAPGQGKTLDFLCQELFREITTMGSKITAHEGSSLLIEAKATIERMREQVQNVE